MKITSNANQEETKALDARSAAKYLSVSYFTLRELVHAGKLTSVRLPAPNSGQKTLRKLLFLRSDLDAFLEKYRQQASS